MFLVSPENEKKEKNDKKQKKKKEEYTANKEKGKKTTAVIATGKQSHKPQLCMYARRANTWI